MEELEKPKVYITKKLIDDIEHSEIDFDLHNQFGFNYDTHSDFIEIENDQGSSEGYPIDIDRLIKTLTDMKSKGTTHIEMNYHCDHIGYQITGYEIKFSTKDEIDVYENEALTIRQRRAKIRELYRQIQELEK